MDRCLRENDDKKKLFQHLLMSEWESLDNIKHRFYLIPKGRVEIMVDEMAYFPASPTLESVYAYLRYQVHNYDYTLANDEAAITWLKTVQPRTLKSLIEHFLDGRDPCEFDDACDDSTLSTSQALAGQLFEWVIEPAHKSRVNVYMRQYLSNFDRYGMSPHFRLCKDFPAIFDKAQNMYDKKVANQQRITTAKQK